MVYYNEDYVCDASEKSEDWASGPVWPEERTKASYLEIQDHCQDEYYDRNREEARDFYEGPVINLQD